MLAGISREERRLIRQRGAGTRELKDVGFGFQFGAGSNASQNSPKDGQEYTASAPLVRSRKEAAVPPVAVSPARVDHIGVKHEARPAETKKRGRPAKATTAAKSSSRGRPAKKPRLDVDDMLETTSEAVKPTRQRKGKARTGKSQVARSPPSRDQAADDDGAGQVDTHDSSGIEADDFKDAVEVQPATRDARGNASPSPVSSPAPPRRRGRPKKQLTAEPTSELEVKAKRGRRTKAQTAVVEPLNDGRKMNAPTNQLDEAAPSRARRGPKSKGTQVASSRKARTMAEAEPDDAEGPGPVQDKETIVTAEAPLAVPSKQQPSIRYTPAVPSETLSTMQSKKRKHPDSDDTDFTKAAHEVNKHVLENHVQPRSQRPPVEPAALSQANPPKPKERFFPARSNPKRKAPQKLAKISRSKEDEEGSLGAVLARYGAPKIPKTLVGAADARLSRFRF